MKRIMPSMILFILTMMFLLISCKKDEQSTIRPATQPPAAQPSSGDWKIDTVFQFTAASYFPLIRVIEIRKDFYISIPDSVSSSGLKVSRVMNSGSFQEVQPYSIQAKGPCYLRGKGKITYAELIAGYSSVQIRVKISGKW